MIWREPPEETEDYPGIVVKDGRVAGSMTVGRGGPALWWFAEELAQGGVAEADDAYDFLSEGIMDAKALAEFLGHLLGLRGEFARLLSVLADVERQEEEWQEEEGPTVAWWEDPDSRARVVESLRRCLKALGEEA